MKGRYRVIADVGAAMHGLFAIAVAVAVAMPIVATPTNAATVATGGDASHAQAEPSMSSVEMPSDSMPPREMSYREMADTMQMDDTKGFGKVMLDQLEWRDGDGGEGRGAWDAQGYFGGDYDKLWIKTEGKYTSGSGTGIRDADVEILWDRVISAWWNLQAGARQDFGPGQSRTWAAVGIQGLAPQWLQSEVTVYASDAGRTAARLKAQYDLLLTQRLVLQPFAEANLYGRSDPAHQIGSGLSDLQISLRLRYEIRRELAPYIGVVFVRRMGRTADLARSVGEDASDLELTAGVRIWL
jgi:copper resistance protein B